MLIKTLENRSAYHKIIHETPLIPALVVPPLLKERGLGGEVLKGRGEVFSYQGKIAKDYFSSIELK